jgi:hypothetical protein
MLEELLGPSAALILGVKFSRIGIMNMGLLYLIKIGE